METDNKNENNCPLLNQSGRDGIKDFDNILAHLPPDQRRAFERERTERLADLWVILTRSRYA
jgi:hypothetical protein